MCIEYKEVHFGENLKEELTLDGWDWENIWRYLTAEDKYLGAYFEGDLIALAMYDADYLVSAYYLDGLETKTGFKKQGIASKLIAMIGKELLENGKQNLFIGPLEEAINFYLHLGGRLSGSDIVFGVEELQRLIDEID